MAALKNIRHEQFAQNLAAIGKTGGTNGNAYTRAGYRCENGAAEAAASRMLADVRNGVADRVRELMAGGARRVEVTVASLLNELEQARVGALDDGQFSASVAAIAGKARLSGLDRPENGGAGGEFANCETEDDVMCVLLADKSVGEVLESLAVMSAQVEAYAASHATVVRQKKTLPGLAEAGSSLALFRRRR